MNLPAGSTTDLVLAYDSTWKRSMLTELRYRSTMMPRYNLELKRTLTSSGFH